MERDGDWWLDGERRWQRGVPPEGWERDPVGAVVLLGGALLFTIVTGRDEPSPPDRGDPASALPAPSTSTSTTAPSPAGELALCGPGQRNLIERANHPWAWYVERFDPDGNGVFCE